LTPAVQRLAARKLEVLSAADSLDALEVKIVDYHR
jgi:hypothetical protein